MLVRADPHFLVPEAVLGFFDAESVMILNDDTQPALTADMRKLVDILPAR